MKNNVKKIRISLGYSQIRFAELCGVSRQTIHAIEVSKYQPSITLAIKISNHLKKDLRKIFILEKGD